MPDQILDKRTVHRGWLNLLLVKARLSGHEVEREVVEHPSGAVVFPYDPSRRVALLVTQSRLPIMVRGRDPIIEVLGGALDGDHPEDCARREALEEGGVRLNRLDHVAQVWPTPATSTEVVDYYLAEYRQADRVSPGGGVAEENEYLRVREVPLSQLWHMATTAALHDAKTLLLVQALKLRRPDLYKEQAT
jgi:nudix-type nucleoside diphosphatase (YffH/AdpP family)